MALPTASDNQFPKVILEEVLSDGSATTTPAADHQALFLGEDGVLHLKDSAATVTDVGGTETLPVTILDAAGDIIYATAADTAARLPLGTAGQVLTVNAGATAPEWAAGGGGGAVELIDDQTLGSDTATIDFTSISGSYKHLRLIVQARSTRAAQTEDNVFFTFNADTGNNYDSQLLQVRGTGTAISEALAGANSGVVMIVPAASSPAGSASSFVIEIPNYAGTTFNKSFTCHGSAPLTDSANGMRLESSAGEWRSTAAITRITLDLVNGNFLAGSRATLYGIN